MSTALFCGVLAFALMLAFDCRKAAGKQRGNGALFAAGLLLLAGTTLWLLFPLVGRMNGWRIASGVWALAWLAALLYVLFFALPAGDVYGEQQSLSVCTAGAYALCRHPGGWCLLFANLGLWGLAGTARMGVGALAFSALNFLYILLQDRFLFPRYIAGYKEYRAQTPFLLPNRRSIAACFSGKGEDQGNRKA